VQVRNSSFCAFVAYSTFVVNKHIASTVLNRGCQLTQVDPFNVVAAAVAVAVCSRFNRKIAVNIEAGK